MTRERINELWPAMEAFKAGKRIRARQLRTHGTYGPWVVITDPTWSDGVEYEVMPEPREVWLNEYPTGLCLVFPSYGSQREADQSAAPNRIRAIRFVGVVE